MEGERDRDWDVGGASMEWACIVDTSCRCQVHLAPGEGGGVPWRCDWLFREMTLGELVAEEGAEEGAKKSN